MCQVEGFFGTVYNYRIVAYRIYGEQEVVAGAELKKAIENCSKGPVPKSIEEEIRVMGDRFRELEARFGVEIRAV